MICALVISSLHILWLNGKGILKEKICRPAILCWSLIPNTYQPEGFWRCCFSHKEEMRIINLMFAKLQDFAEANTFLGLNPKQQTVLLT
jgi:hypothetical protein